MHCDDRITLLEMYYISSDVMRLVTVTKEHIKL